MAISGFIGKRNIEKLEVRLEFPQEIYANVEFPLKIILLNHKRFLPVFIVRVNFREFSVLFSKPVNVQEKIIMAKIDKRGEYRIDSVDFCTVFPFNFFKRCVKNKVSFEKIVFPQPKRCEFVENGIHDFKKRGESQMDKSGYEGDIIGVRDYSPGTPIRYIHWKASAKLDSFKAKEFSQSKSNPVIIDFEAIQSKSFEEKLSCITFLVINSRNAPEDVFIKYENSIFYTKSRSESLAFLEMIAKL